MGSPIKETFGSKFDSSAVRKRKQLLTSLPKIGETRKLRLNPHFEASLKHPCDYYLEDPWICMGYSDNYVLFEHPNYNHGLPKIKVLKTGPAVSARYHMFRI